MATTMTPSYVRENGGRTHKASWTFTSNETGLPFGVPSASDRSVEVVGTFNSATVILEGTNTGDNETAAAAATWTTLTDQAATALSFTTNGLRVILQPTRWIRARVSSGSVTSVTVTVIANRRN